MRNSRILAVLPWPDKPKRAWVTCRRWRALPRFPSALRILPKVRRSLSLARSGTA